MYVFLHQFLVIRLLKLLEHGCHDMYKISLEFEAEQRITSTELEFGIKYLE